MLEYPGCIGSRRQSPLRIALLVAATLVFCSQLSAAIGVTLTAAAPSPQPLAEIVTFEADADAPSDSALYRFRSRSLGSEFHTVRDFSPLSRLEWTATDSEGVYEIEVTVRDRGTGEMAVKSMLYEMTPRVTGPRAIVSDTRHPLVFLYSAPPCASGAAVRVRVQSPEGTLLTTPSKPCLPGRTSNFYLAGLRPYTEYRARHVVTLNGQTRETPDVTFSTREAVGEFMERTVLQPPAGETDDLLFESPLAAPMMATDLWGNIVWFYTEYISFATRPDADGHFFGIVQALSGDTSEQVVREFDLAGITQSETNAARVNEQLAALGMHPISGFHHEALRLPDGRLLVLASSERILENVQGPGRVNILGDTIVVLDRDLQVTWAWDSFDHLDPRREALLGEKCSSGACPPTYLDTDANDWLHANSVQLTPDGNLLVSLRHQDWLIKIDYNHGHGTGAVLWRLGRGGDFTFLSSDPYPWFSHQHDARYIDDHTIVLFDNGNLRRDHDPSANSRGQVIRLDEEHRTATLLLNADLGEYSFALGSAQKLPNGNFHFELGWVVGGSSLSVEVDPAGSIVYSLRASLPRYRTFRMPSMYTPY